MCRQVGQCCPKGRLEDGDGTAVVAFGAPDAARHGTRCQGVFVRRHGLGERQHLVDQGTSGTGSRELEGRECVVVQAAQAQGDGERVRGAQPIAHWLQQGECVGGAACMQTRHGDVDLQRQMTLFVERRLFARELHRPLHLTFGELEAAERVERQAKGLAHARLQ